MKPSKHHACATGACDHQFTSECVKAIALHADELAAEREALTEALTPSGETMKAFSGRFSSGLGGWGDPPQTIS